MFQPSDKINPRRKDKALEAVHRRHARAAAERVLKLFASGDDRLHAAETRRVGDEDAADPLVRSCEGPLRHTPYAFLLARKEFPPFASLLRPNADNARKLDAVEREFAEAEEAYGALTHKWFKGLVFEVGGHLYLYTDQALEEYQGLDHLRFTDRERPRCVCSLEAFVEASRR